MHFRGMHKHIGAYTCIACLHIFYIYLAQCWTCNERTSSWILLLLLCTAVGKYKVFAHAHPSISLSPAFIRHSFYHYTHYCLPHSHPRTLSHAQNYRTNEYLNKCIQGAFKTAPQLIHPIRKTNTNVIGRCGECAMHMYMHTFSTVDWFSWISSGMWILLKSKSPWVQPIAIYRDKNLNRFKTKWKNLNGWWHCELVSRRMESNNVVMQRNGPTQTLACKHTNTHTNKNP